MRKQCSFIAVSILLSLACSALAQAQITAEDILFSRLSTTTSRMAYEQRGGDMKEVAPLLDEASKSATSDPLKAFRTYLKAATLMNGTKWSPDAELATALNFSLNVKAVGVGERLQAYATFLFDVPAAANAPYRLELEVLKPDATKEATIEPGIVLGDAKTRH